MKRCISVYLLMQLCASVTLFSMYSSFRNSLGAARTLYGLRSGVVPQVSAFSSSDSHSAVEQIAQDFQPSMSRRVYTSYSDQAPLHLPFDAQDEFVQDEQWQEGLHQRGSKFLHSSHFSRSSYTGDSYPATSSKVSRTMHGSSKDPEFDASKYLLQSIVSMTPSSSSRVQYSDDDLSPIISKQKYEPVAYGLLNPLQKKLISEDEYAKFVKEYNDLKDVKIDQFTYMVDGQPVTGFALLPKTSPVNGKYPLVVAFRGGFNGEGPFHEWAKIDLPYIMRHFAFYAKNGYAVLTSQYRGADGNTNKDQFGGDDVHDALGLFDVAREMGNIDLGDVSLSAFSRGTVMAYKTLKEIKDKIPVKAVVIKGGISDLNTFVNEDPKYIKPILEQARPEFNEDKEKICTDISLVADTKVLEDIPTLVMHNEHDNVVPSKLSRNLVEQLQKNGIEYEAHFFLGKHHQILESNNEVQKLTIDWLNRHRNKIKSSL